MEQEKTHYIDTLTPLRGIAALWIVATHVDAMIVRLLPYESTGLITKGYLWVDFFLLLSGFIICHVYGDRFTGNATASSVQSYLVARFARMYPVHLFTLGLFTISYLLICIAEPDLAQGPAFEAMFDVRLLLVNLIMGHAFGLTDGASWNVLSWSVAAEWWTYFVAIPIFQVLNVGLRRRTWLITALCILGLCILSLATENRGLDVTYDYGFLRCLFEFTIGIVLYQIYRAGWWKAHLTSDAGFALSSVVVLFLMHVEAPDVFLVIAFSLLILNAAANKGQIRRVLGKRPFQLLGEISYSIYMVQSIWLFVVMVGFSITASGQSSSLTVPELYLLAAAVVALILVTAILTHYFVEVLARLHWRVTLEDAFVKSHIQREDISSAVPLAHVST